MQIKKSSTIKPPPVKKSFFRKVNSFFLLRRTWFRKAVKAIWILFFCIVLGIPLYVYAVILNPFNLFGGMPSLKAVENPENDLSSEVISADGVLLGRYIRFHRSEVSYDEIPEQLVTTLLVSEDHRFFQHSGMDFWSMLRVLRGIITFTPMGGGSTLSQQTAKNLFQTRGSELQGSLARLATPFELLISKTKEWIIAVELEKTFTKEELIALYLNTVPFNNNAYGIKVAAETYFQKTLDKLSLQESAVLVGMLQGTYRFNPVDFPERALRKRNEVLTKLYVHKYIESSAALDSVKALPIELNFAVPDHNEGLATYFRDVLQRFLITWCKENGYDLYESGLKIHVTLDSRMQQFAEAAMATHLRSMQSEFDDAWKTQNPWVDATGIEISNFLQNKVKRTDTYKRLVNRYGENTDSLSLKLTEKKPMKIFSWKGERDTMFSVMDSLGYYNRFLQSGLLAMNPITGEIKAWVGGLDHKYFQFDHVHQAKRQAGSAFKPFVFGRAMEDGYNPCFQLYDISPVFNINGTIYHPKNFNGTYGDGKKYTLRQALAKSLNTITLQLVDKIQPQHIVDFAVKLGITSKLDPVYSLGLGTSDVALDELVAAYSSFVNLGIYTKPYYITRIEDKYGNVVANFVPNTKLVMDEKVAYTMVYMLKGGVEEEGGTSRALSQAVLSDNEVGGKTGTTDDASDGWYIGITHNLVTGVWVGGDEPSIHLPPGLGSGSRSALPIWDKFMTQVYNHPEVQYFKGKFKLPMSIEEIRLDCKDYDDSDLPIE